MPNNKLSFYIQDVLVQEIKGVSGHVMGFRDLLQALTQLVQCPGTAGRYSMLGLRCDPLAAVFASGRKVPHEASVAPTAHRVVRMAREQAFLRVN